MDMDDDYDEAVNPTSLEKYRVAAEVANAAMITVLQSLQPGQKILDICALGDKSIEDLCQTNPKAKKTKKEDKGVAFPTCVSVNHCAGHYCPLPEESQKVLNVGDLVKIDLAVHIDGFISTCAHTYIVGQNPEAGPSQGKMADAICAAYFASEIAHRLVRPGKTNTEVTQAIEKVAKLFNCKPVEGVLSHQLKQNIIDGNNVILNRSEPDQQVEEFKFESNQAYGIDIVISTGEGKTKEGNERITVFKRALDRNYNLKVQASRQLLAEISKKHPILPFSLRDLDEKKRRLGIVEILKHELLDTYPVLYEKDGEFVAQFKFTVITLTNQTLRLNSFPLPHVTSQYSVESDPELVAALQLPISWGGNKKKKKKAKAAQAAQPAQPAQEPPKDSDMTEAANQ